jgi:hypothetical protein
LLQRHYCFLPRWLAYAATLFFSVLLVGFPELLGSSPFRGYSWFFGAMLMANACVVT